MIKERVTVDFDSESYYLDGKYWESWDNYGEEMAEKINKLLDKYDKQMKELEKENYELKSIKRFTEKYGINVFHIETAFRNCWNDNAKLVDENKQLKNDLDDALNRIKERSVDVQLLKEENRNLKKENELKGDFRNFINEDIARIKKENAELRQKLFGIK